jgi:ABC-2 type transport system permease protein
MDDARRDRLRLSLLRIRKMVRKELRQLLRDPKTQRIIFLPPIVQLILFGYAVNTDVRNMATFLVDHDRTPESRLLADALTSSGYFRVVGSSQSPRDLTRALDQGSAKIGVEIPAGFASRLNAGDGPAVQIILDGTNSNTATVGQGYATRIVQDFGLSWIEASGRPLPAGVDLRARAWFNPDLASRVYNVPAVIGVIVLLMCLLLTAMSVVRERELGTLDQLLVSPLSASEIMLGKTIPVAIIAHVQLFLVVLLLAAAVYILAGLSFGLLASTVSRTQQEAFLVMFLFLMPAIILSGFLYPIETMPPFFQYLTLANPLRHFLEIVRAIFLKGSGLGELWPQYLTLTGMAAVALWFAIRRFRKTLL